MVQEYIFAVKLRWNYPFLISLFSFSVSGKLIKIVLIKGSRAFSIHIVESLTNCFARAGYNHHEEHIQTRNYRKENFRGETFVQEISSTVYIIETKLSLISTIMGSLPVAFMETNVLFRLLFLLITSISALWKGINFLRRSYKLLACNLPSVLRKIITLRDIYWTDEQP